MRYSEKQKVKRKIERDIEELKKYNKLEHFIEEHFQMGCVGGEYDDNSIDLSYHYKMIKEIEADLRFMKKLIFVLGKYVNMSAKANAR